MLQIGVETALATENYYICHREDGMDELHISLPLDDPAYGLITDRSRILETTEQQFYAVRRIVTGKETAEISCVVDLRDWERTCMMNYSNDNATLSATLQGVCPMDWTIEGADLVLGCRTVEMDCPTPLEVAMECALRFHCALRFQANTRTLRVVNPGHRVCSGAFAVEELNLRQQPILRTDCQRLVTRLYVMGKKGLTIESVNNGKPYVENHTYTNEVICGFWKDTRYDDPDALREDAQKRLDVLATPERIWKLKLVDLHRMDPEAWDKLSAALFSVWQIADRRKREQYQVQVVEDRVYPHMPQKNEVIVTTGGARRLYDGLPRVLANPNSVFYQQLNAR